MNRRFAIQCSLLTACLSVLPGCQKGANGNSDAAARTESRAVMVAPAASTNLERTITVFGSFLAQEKVTLSAKVPGRLKSVQVDLGSPVKVGALIAQIEPREYELHVRQSEAALAQALAVIGLSSEDESQTVDPSQTSIAKQAMAVLKEARANRDRAASLHQDGVLSQAELDTAESAFTVADNRYRDAVEEARQRIAVVAQRRIERDIAKQDLADTKLVAPFDSSVQDRVVSPGAYLQAGDPVATLIQVNPLRLRLEISEREAPLIRPEQIVRARVDGITQTSEGRIVRISPAIDQQRRVLLVEAEIPNTGYLHPGMFARADIVVNSSQKAVIVPTDALITFAGIEKVFTIVEGAARERVVTTDRRGTNWVEIVDNLKAGEEVILNPGNLQNGQSVTTAPTPPVASERSTAGATNISAAASS